MKSSDIGPRPSSKVSISVVAGVARLALTAGAAVAAGGFTDVSDDDVFSGDIAWMAENGITAGCNPPDNTRYCPDDEVTRGQMVAFMRRLAQSQVVDAATVQGHSSDELIGAGPQGPKGDAGKDGADGASAYELAVANGFSGAESEWLESCKGRRAPRRPWPRRPGWRGRPGRGPDPEVHLGLVRGRLLVRRPGEWRRVCQSDNGNYLVELVVPDVSKCVFDVTARVEGSSEVRSASYERSSRYPWAIRVYIRDANDTLVGGNFDLIAICPDM